MDENTEKPVTDENNDKAEEDYKSKYLYLLAEVENYKRTKEKEIGNYVTVSNIAMMTDILKVLDDFESVLKAKDDETVRRLFDSLLSVLKMHGLSRVGVVGQKYSEDIAEAVATEKGQVEPGIILEEVQPGYKLNDRIIRYPKVKVSI
jgi:molecular chaperone GrpE